MKSEIFYGQENSSKTVEELKSAITEYIDYSNIKRIKVKLRVIFSLQNLIFGSSIFIILLVNKGNYNHI